MDAFPAPFVAGVGVVEHLQPVQIVQIPLQAHVLAVDLKRIEGLVAAGIAGAFKHAQRAVLEVAEEGAGIVDGHRLYLAGEGVLSLLDECLRHGGDVCDWSVEPQGGVDAVSQQVAGHAAAGGGGIKTPQRRAPLRQVRVDRPILEKLGPVVEDPAQPTGVDELLGKRHGRNAAVVVPDGVGHPRLLDRRHHPFPLGSIHRQGLFAEDCLAMLGRLDGNFRMQIIRSADVDRIDVGGRHQLPPV